MEHFQLSLGANMFAPHPPPPPSPPLEAVGAGAGLDNATFLGVFLGVMALFLLGVGMKSKGLPFSLLGSLRRLPAGEKTYLKSVAGWKS